MNYIAKKIALQEKNILNHADLYLDYNNRIAFHKNRKINLTVKEFDILFFLASYPGQVFTHRQIYETVWGKEYFCDEGNVTAHIGHIRKKIELDPRNPVFIQTVRGIGYKFRETKVSPPYWFISCGFCFLSVVPAPDRFVSVQDIDSDFPVSASNPAPLFHSSCK